MKVGIVGLGLIGGSIGLKLKQRDYQVFGIDLNLDHQRMALDLGLVQEILSLEEAMCEMDAIILAIPVDKMEMVLSYVLDHIDSNQFVFDVGSTKEKLCQVVSNHNKRSRFVAAHPLAGTEFSGPRAAFPNLFEGKKNIICEEDRSDEDALESTIEIITALGMQTYFMNPKEHDKHLAYVSHLSHLSSFVLGLTVLDIEKDEKQIVNLAGTGFESTVRLAKSAPVTWSAIFDRNSHNISDALESYIDHLQYFKQLLDNNDTDGMMVQMEKANEIKHVLKGLKMNIVKLS